MSIIDNINTELNTNKVATLYIELLKKNLLYSMWEEPPIPLKTFNYRRSIPKQIIINFITNILEKFNFELGKTNSFSQADLKEGRVWPKNATTMIGKERIDNLHHCIEQILKENVEGHFIETGVWRGGACILMSGVLHAHGDFKRKIYVADSFKGIPPPDNAYPADRLLKWHTEKYLSVSLEEVKENFRKFDLLSDQIIFIEGFFKDTLPNAKIDCLSLLRLDGDMYSSTYESLTYLYPKLSSGGYVIVDDYALNNCRQAVDDYREKFKIKTKMVQIDWTGWFWKKE